MSSSNDEVFEVVLLLDVSSYFLTEFIDVFTIFSMEFISEFTFTFCKFSSRL
eukprot:07126.XXX_111162_111317_1 [CDS] Oithona nana genome sequencing.